MVNFTGTTGRHRKYEAIGDDEALRAKRFRKVKEYEFYWLCEKLDQQGNTLYRECFSKWDLGKSNRAETRKKREATRYWKEK